MSENKLTSIEKFPPQLQKIATYLALSDRKISIRQVCKKLSLNYNSVLIQIHDARKKGYDFNDILGEEAKNYAKSKINDVVRSMTKKAISGSEKHQNLYFKYTGIIKDSPLISIDNRSLTVVVSPSVSAPAKVQTSLPEEQIAELEIEGPKHNQS